MFWSGRWVMLENVHLAPAWLMQLEKKLHSMQPHASFRLFLTMEINPKVNHITSKIFPICHNLDNEDYSDTWSSPKVPFLFHSSKSPYCVFLPGASESTSCWSYLCVWASSWCQGQHAQNLQQHSCGSHVQGDLIWTYQPSRFSTKSLTITINVYTSS